MRQRPELAELDALPASLPTTVPELAARLQAMVPGLELRLTEREGIFTVDRIVVPDGQRRTGLGSQVMTALCAYADRQQLSMALTPDDAFGTSKTALTRFYRRFGFRPNKGRHKDFRVMESMVRDPESPQPTR